MPDRWMAEHHEASLVLILVFVFVLKLPLREELAHGAEQHDV
jgi:hypothetical protein